jgi:membrane protein implicated in regulation of membrane protease activity
MTQRTMWFVAAALFVLAAIASLVGGQTVGAIIFAVVAVAMLLIGRSSAGDARRR